jgi:hypothetical protein
MGLERRARLFMPVFHGNILTDIHFSGYNDPGLFNRFHAMQKMCPLMTLALLI